MDEITNSNTKSRRGLLVFNSVLIAIGGTGGSLVIRLYFLHGGRRVWLTSFLQTAGFPLILIPLTLTFLRRRRRHGPSAPLFKVRPFLFAAFAVIGLFIGLDSYFYAYGAGRLPVSTSALIITSQLAFTATFAFFLVRQRFTPFSINSVALLTLSGGILAMHSGSDRPPGESSRQYVAGFLMTVAAAALYGFLLPLIELSYLKGKQKITYSLVLELQLVMCFFASVLCAVGMIVNNDFKVISREAKEFELGETKYYVVLVSIAVLWQSSYMGSIGVIFCSSSLLCGIIIAVLLPVGEVLAVIFYKEKFQAEKGVSLALSLWGFVSYFYGEMKQNKMRKEENQNPETEIAQLQSTPVLNP